MKLLLIDKLKKIPIRFIVWIFAFCIPCSIYFVRLSSNLIKTAENQELQSKKPTGPLTIDLSTQTTSSELMLVKCSTVPIASPGIGFANKQSEMVQTKKTTVSLDEPVMTFMFQSAAKQKALLEKSIDKMELLLKQYDLQKKEQATLTERLSTYEKKLQTANEKTAELEGKMKKKEVAEKLSIKKIAKLYSVMAPEKVAKILEGMDDESVTTLLSNMKELDVSKIMVNMPPRRVATITLRMSDLKSKP